MHWRRHLLYNAPVESTIDNSSPKAAVRNVISFANVAARYDGGNEVLSDVSFNINSHSFYFLTGASGAGKTTLLRLIYHLHAQSRGQIKLFGKNTAGLTHDEISGVRRKMAIVFQEYSLISHLSVFDNVALPLRVRGTNESYTKKLVARTLQWVGLAQYAGALPMNLSGGQQQRVAVARAVITQPEILLADEPTGNLDDDSAAKLMELFIQMNKSFGTAIILATHSRKLLDTYNFPQILVADRGVHFQQSHDDAPFRRTAKSGRNQITEDIPVAENNGDAEPGQPRDDAGKKSENYFATLSTGLEKQFADIAQTDAGGDE